MSRKIRYCTACNQYTMQKNCPECSGETVISGPHRFSPEDRFGEYRRMAKLAEKNGKK